MQMVWAFTFKLDKNISFLCSCNYQQPSHEQGEDRGHRNLPLPQPSDTREEQHQSFFGFFSTVRDTHPESHSQILPSKNTKTKKRAKSPVDTNTVRKKPSSPSSSSFCCCCLYSEESGRYMERGNKTRGNSTLKLSNSKCRSKDSKVNVTWDYWGQKMGNGVPNISAAMD